MAKLALILIQVFKQLVGWLFTEEIKREWDEIGNLLGIRFVVPFFRTKLSRAVCR